MRPNELVYERNMRAYKPMKTNVSLSHLDGTNCDGHKEHHRIKGKSHANCDCVEDKLGNAIVYQTMCIKSVW